jgi:hypothetical protein
MESGMSMMLKSLGFDTEGVKRDLEQFMNAMKTGVEKINTNQVRIEEKLDRIERLVEHPGTTTAIERDGEPSGVLLTTEKFPREILEDAGMQFSEVDHGKAS